MAENRILFHLFFCYIFFSKIIELAKELLLNDNGINIIYLYIAAHSIMKTSLLCIYFSKPKKHSEKAKLKACYGQKTINLTVFLSFGLNNFEILKKILENLK